MIQWFLVNFMVGQPLPPSFYNILIIPKVCLLSTSVATFSIRQSLIILISFSINWSFLDISCKLNHAIFADSPIDGHSDFQFWAIINNAFINILCVDISFHFSWIYTLKWNTGFYDKFKKLPIIFQSGCTIFHFHQQCMKFPVSPHTCQHLV